MIKKDKQNNVCIDPQIQNGKPSLLLKRVVALKDNRRFLLPISSILYFYFSDDRVKIVTDKNLVYNVEHSLHFWEEKLLEKNFLRVHKGFVVNLEKVVEIVPYFNSTFMLKMSGTENTVPVGRKFLKVFKNAVGL